MKIHRCERCEGCGYIVGGFRWETPWTHAVQEDEAADPAGVLEARPCPDCGATGALIVMEAAAEPALPSRYGIRPLHPYARHVDLVRRIQSRQRSS